MIFTVLWIVSLRTCNYIFFYIKTCVVSIYCVILISKLQRGGRLLEGGAQKRADTKALIYSRINLFSIFFPLNPRDKRNFTRI